MALATALFQGWSGPDSEHVRLLDRSDTSLAIALIASALVIFQQPLRVILDAAREAEAQYRIDLIPGLTVLVATFAFHQYRKRQQAKAAAQAAEARLVAAHEWSDRADPLPLFYDTIFSDER